MLGALLCGLAPAASAQEEGAQGGPALSSSHPEWSDRDNEARSLFEAGVLAYNGGHYEDAQESFQRSYDLSGRPALLHNIATAAERANNDREALDAYREFLRLEPNTSRRERVEVRIAALEELLGAQAAQPAPSPGGTTSSGDVGPGPWVVVGISAAVLVAGGVLVGLAAADVAAVENAERESRWAAVADAYERSEPMSIAGFVALGVGVVGVGLGLGWALAGGGASDSASLELEVQPGGLALRGTMP